MAPLDPGYSITMKPQSLRDYTYPTGRIWTEKKKGRKETDIIKDEFKEIIPRVSHERRTFLITGAQVNRSLS
jgi:hypothetical protein